MTKLRQFILRVCGNPLPNFLGVNFPPKEADIVRHWLWVDDSKREGHQRLKKSVTDEIFQTVVKNLLNYWKTSNPNCVLKSKHYVLKKVKGLITRTKSLGSSTYKQASEPWLIRQEKLFNNVNFNIDVNSNLPETDQAGQSDILDSKIDVSTC